jgi:hypothetical protein
MQQPEPIDMQDLFGYLRRIREGKVKTSNGRPILNSDELPDFCYIICDLTPQMRKCCEDKDFQPTRDGMGYFKYHATLKAYFEVISFDAMVKAAKARNRALFDRLGLPTG